MQFYDRLENELGTLASSDSQRAITPLPHHAAFVEKEGRRLINLASNDYLGIGSRNDLLDDFLAHVPEGSKLMGSGSSRLLTGNFPIAEELENQLAQLFGTESALVFNSGYHMNLGILPALVHADSRTLIVADKLVHASIIDGIRLSHAPFERYKHNDLEALGRILERATNDYETIILVTESIYSMDGDTTDLKALVELKRKYPNLLLYVDEAHAIGVRGRRGLGIAEESGTIQEIDFLCGTFGKAIGSMGGYIVCKRVVRDALINRARSFIYSTALPPLSYAWTLYIVNKLSEFSSERALLDQKAKGLREAMSDLGLPMPSSSHIVPVMVGTNERAVRLSNLMNLHGFYAPALRPPTVPIGSARLRISLSSICDSPSIASTIKDCLSRL